MTKKISLFNLNIALNLIKNEKGLKIPDNIMKIQA